MTTKKVNQYWITENGITSFASAIIASVALAFALHYTRGIMIPFVLSLFVYFILSPIRSFFIKKLKFPRSLALLTTFIVVFLILFVVFLILSSAIRQFISGYSLYQAKAVYFADEIQAFLVGMGIPMEDINLSDLVKNLPFVQLFRGAGAWALSLVSTTSLVFIFLLFLFTGSPVKKEGENEEESEPQETRISEVGKEINSQISKYLSVKLFASSVTAVLVFIILSIFKLDLAFVFAFLTFILNFIPTVGSIFAVFLPLPVAFLQYDSSLMILLVLLVPGAVQFGIGSILEPKMMGRSLNIHPITVLLSLMFWSLIWGIVGAFLAVPITAVLKIVLTKIEGGKYISNWMSGSMDEPVG